MAVMTTQQPESLGLEEKSVKTVAATADDSRNGGIETNGRLSPAKSDSALVPANVENSNTLNEDAFMANQDLPAKPNGTEHVKNTPPETAKEEEALTSHGGPATDTEMTDAPARSATPPTQEQSTQVKTNSSSSPPSPAALQISTEVATGSPASSAVSPRTKEDVVMRETRHDASETTGAIGEGTAQQTFAHGADPVTPDEEPSQKIKADADLSKEGPFASPPAPQTADASMSEPSQRLTREREEDSDGEPAAKRTKLANTSVKTEPSALIDQDRMDVDHAAAPPVAPSLYHANGQPKDLNDASLDTHALTEHMSKALRNILAGVKKTKAGAMFRLPVRELWPHIWTDYSSRVPDPIDISAIEKKLRGDLPKYATMGDFKDDVHRLVKNSILFNGEAHEVTAASMTTRESIFTRMAAHHAVEPSRPEKKEGVKQHTTRHAEPRSSAAAAAAPTPLPKKAAVAEKPPVVDSPAFAIPANNNGVPLIRRDSTKPDSRTKRPVKPAHPKDLVYDTKRKKLSPELRFCETVLEELKKNKYYDINSNFLHPVDPVALNIPSYHKIVKKPMDLTTMSKKLGAGEYQSAKEFERDFDLIVKNCRLFNGDEHAVYKLALELQQLFRREFGRKDEWMAKNAPAVAPARRTASPVPKNDSDDEDAESEVEQEEDDEDQSAQRRLDIIHKRLDEENKKLTAMIQGGIASIEEVELSQSVVALLQRNLMTEKAKLAAMPPKKPAKSKPTKTKKAGATAPGKKAVGGGGGSSSGPSKKGSTTKKAPPKRKMTQAHKSAIAANLDQLDGDALTMSIEIIKKDTGQGENDSGELELDIDQLSDQALQKLYDILIKEFPQMRVEQVKSVAAPPPAETHAPRAKTAPKTKKNKPMTKFEQERRIAQLNELRAQAGRQGSGSQEPMESIEGNGTAPAAAQPVAPTANVDSDDEESSEEE